ncbi:MAG TPA: hypothetical protein VGL56_06395 [Fimbriimonadaceae bacterium]|jgi:hypothetical protein
MYKAVTPLALALVCLGCHGQRDLSVITTPMPKGDAVSAAAAMGPQDAPLSESDFYQRLQSLPKDQRVAFAKRHSAEVRGILANPEKAADFLKTLHGEN